MRIVNFGTSAQATGGDHLRPVLRDPAGLVLAADHEPGDVLEEDERDLRWAQSSTKWAPFRADWLNRIPSFATIPTGQPSTWAKPVTSVSP
jgi:hypothetical protein